MQGHIGTWISKYHSRCWNQYTTEREGSLYWGWVLKYSCVFNNMSKQCLELSITMIQLMLLIKCAESSTWPLWVPERCSWHQSHAGRIPCVIGTMLVELLRSPKQRKSMTWSELTGSHRDVIVKCSVESSVGSSKSKRTLEKCEVNLN